MTQTVKTPAEMDSDSTAMPTPIIHVAPGPHVGNRRQSTRSMMTDVLIAMVPLMLVALYVFRAYALKQVLICVAAAMASEALLTYLRKRKVPLWDASAIVTGMILGLSLPWQAPWFVGVIGAAVAIVLGKFLFGGLGHNIFNPAMVGRAFITIAFPAMLGAAGYTAPGAPVIGGPDVDAPAAVAEPAAVTGQTQAPGEQTPQPATAGVPTEYVTQATPMSAAKEAMSKAIEAQATQREAARLPQGEARVAAERTIERLRRESAEAQANIPSLGRLFLGNTNGSLGEVSALACLLGGLFLVIRRTASWEIPAGMLAAVAGIGALAGWAQWGMGFGALHHLFGGAVLFGAFFIATDPVSSPLTPRGKLTYGLIIGVMVMLLRLFSGYPEGVQFAVLFANGLVPLLNRWTIPTPLGGPTKQ